MGLMGLIGGVGQGMADVADQNTKFNNASALQAQQDQAIADRERSLAQLRVQLANEPLERVGALARPLIGQPVPQEPAPVTSLTGAGAPAYPDGSQSSGLQGSPAAVQAQVEKQLATYPEGPEKDEIRSTLMAQLSQQKSADTAANAQAVAGQTRPRTPGEALEQAVELAKANDPVAYAAYEREIGKPMRDEKRIAIQEDRADAIASHYAQMDSIRAQGEVGKDARNAANIGSRERIADEKIAATSMLTPEMEITAKAIAEGRLPPLTGYAMRSPGASAIMAKVMELNPNYSGKDYGTGQKAEKDFATGKLGNTARSFNVALAHLDTLSGLADALDNGNVQLINKLGNAYASQTGGTAPVNFDAAKRIVADEIVKAVTGSSGALGDRDSASSTVNAANSPAQLKSVIEVYKNLMGGQLDGLRMQYKSTTGKADFDSKYLSAAAQAIGQHGAASAASGPAIGFVKDGYRFNGGDPSNSASWSPVQ